MFRSTVLLSALLLVAGCAASADDTAQGEDDFGQGTGPAISASATYARVLTGTPTYGYYPTAPVLSITLSTNDDAILRDHPGFDGYERAFALIPRAAGADVRWERVDLRYRGPSRQGYYLQYVRDEYASEPVRLSDEDLAVSQREGIALGIDTNVGTVWAQKPGDNLRPVAAQR